MINRDLIPEQWEIKKISEIGKVKGGKRLPKGASYAETKTPFPYLRVVDFENQSINQSQLRYLSPEVQKTIRNYTISKNDVFISIAGTIGVTGVIPENLDGANLTENAAKITDLQGVYNKYLSLYLSSICGQSQIKNHTISTTQPKLSLFRIDQIVLPLPHINEQKEIVFRIEELFSELDKSIDELKTAQQQLKVYRQSVLKWAFEGKLTNEEVKEGELPEGWKWVKIESLLYDQKRGMSTGPFGMMLKKHEHVLSGTPVLGIENIGEGTFQMPNKIFITREKAEELKNFKVKENDIIISRSGTVGEICIVPENMKNSVISTNLIRVRLNLDVISPKYFVYMFQGGQVRDQVRELCKGSTRAFLNQGILSSLNFPYCDIKEQHLIVQEIESRLSVADKMEETIVNNLEQAEALRQSILKKAFEGNLYSII